MSQDGDISNRLNRRQLLQTAALASATGLAGCSVSTPLGEFEASGGGDDETETPTPTPVTAVRSTDTPTSVPTETETETLATPITDPELNVDPELVNASTSPDIESVTLITPAAENGTFANVPQPTPAQVDPSVFETEPETDFSDLPEPDYDLGEPEPVNESGDIAVTVTPELGLEKNERLGSQQTEETDDTVCRVQRRRVTAGGGPNILLNPELGTIWPGAILSAGSIARGQYSPALTHSRRDGTPITEIRQPLELSLSLRNISGDNTRTIDPPSKGNYRTELDSILSQYDDNAKTPANMSYQIRQIHSSEQLDVELGAHYSNPAADIENQFDFSSESETNKLLVKFYQKYYTAGISLPNPLAEGIVSKPSLYLKDNDVVVDQVTYGRILLFAAESNYQRTRVKNALDVAVNSGVQNTEVSLDLEKEQVLEETEISGTVIGGAAQDAVQTISEPGENALPAIKSFIRDGARYDPETSPGAPIAYRTRYLSNLNTANTYLTTTYNERNCQPKTNKYRVYNCTWKLMDESDPGPSEEVYGSIAVGAGAVYKDGSFREVAPRGQNNFEIWSRGQSGHKELREGQHWNTSAEALIEFPNAPELDRERSFIDIAAEPHEWDSASNDEWGGWKKVRWYLNGEVTDPDTTANQKRGKFHSLHWRDHGSEIEFSFDVSPVPP